MFSRSARLFNDLSEMKTNIVHHERDPLTQHKIRQPSQAWWMFKMLFLLPLLDGNIGKLFQFVTVLFSTWLFDIEKMYTNDDILVV